MDKVLEKVHKMSLEELGEYILESCMKHELLGSSLPLNLDLWDKVLCLPRDTCLNAIKKMIDKYA